jgi:hypothetical protein
LVVGSQATSTEHPTDSLYQQKVAAARAKGGPAKPSKWMEFIDENNRVYYYNFHRNIARYESADPPEQPEPEPELAAAAAAAGGTLTPHPPPPPRQSQLHPALQGLASGGGAAKPSKFSELRDLPMDDGDDDELEGGGGESLLLLFRVC